MSASRERSSCPHLDFAARVTVNRIEDAGAYTADVSINCHGCGEPFRFIGVPSGVSFEHPTVSIDGLELRAPIEPELVKVLHTRATFQVPPPRREG